MAKELYVSVLRDPLVAPDCCVARFEAEGILDGVIGESDWPDDTCVIINTDTSDPEVAECMARDIASNRAYHRSLLSPPGEVSRGR